MLVLADGILAFAATGVFAVIGAVVAVLPVPFVLAGIGVGAVETAQHSAVVALAPTELQGSTRERSAEGLWASGHAPVAPLNPQLTPAAIPSAFGPHIVERSWFRASRWSAPLYERP